MRKQEKQNVSTIKHSHDGSAKSEDQLQQTIVD